MKLDGYNDLTTNRRQFHNTAGGGAVRPASRELPVLTKNFDSLHQSYQDDLSFIQSLDNTNSDSASQLGWVRSSEGSMRPLQGGEHQITRHQYLGSNDREQRQYTLNEQTQVLTVEQTDISFTPGAGTTAKTATYQLNLKTQEIDGWNLMVS